MGISYQNYSSYKITNRKDYSVILRDFVRTASTALLSNRPEAIDLQGQNLQRQVPMKD